jgi:hypothetical protein
VPLINHFVFFDGITHLFGSTMTLEEQKLSQVRDDLMQTKVNSLCEKFPRGSAIKVVVRESRSGLQLGSIHRVEGHSSACGHDVPVFLRVLSAGKSAILEPWEVEPAEM